MEKGKFIQHLKLNKNEKFERLDKHLFMARLDLDGIRVLMRWDIVLNVLQLIVLLLLLATKII